MTRTAALSRADILAATEDVLRRHGPAKATVTDVARALKVSPGTIYRHFPTKSALREAVTHEWLERMHTGLTEIASGEEPALERLISWLDALVAAKRRHFAEDPELFDTYAVLVDENSDVAVAHVGDLQAQLARIVADGIRRGQLEASDPEAVARAVFIATVAFHHPGHAAEWAAPASRDDFAAVKALLTAALGRRA